jgi:hypothetical protein
LLDGKYVEDLMYILVGLPHSGTRFMVATLSLLGLKPNHERKKFNPDLHDGIVSGLHWKLDEVAQFSPVIHQVRHPLGFLGTHSRRNGPKWHKDQYITRDYAPLKPYVLKDAIDHKFCSDIKFLMVWLRANEHIEKYMNPAMRFRVEDMYYASSSMQQLGKELGFDVPWDFQTVCKDGQSGPKPWENEYEWPDPKGYDEQLALVKAKARSYGYLM